MQPNENVASFCYYDPTYSELQQFGPTITCGDFAATDVKTKNDPLTKRQSSSFRFLAVPKGKIPQVPPPPPEAVFKRPDVSRPIVGFEFGIVTNNLVTPGSIYAIPAAIRNTGDSPIIFAKNLRHAIGQEVRPSVARRSRASHYIWLANWGLVYW